MLISAPRNEFASPSSPSAGYFLDRCRLRGLGGTEQIGDLVDGIVREMRIPCRDRRARMRQIIGAGIFVLTGNAAAENAGPAISISFVLGGVACGFAGLCYAELASSVPVAGQRIAAIFLSSCIIFSSRHSSSGSSRPARRS
jgi:hypothetical protein